MEVTDRPTQTSSDSVFMRASAQPAIDVRPTSKRRRTLLAQADGGWAILATARRTVAGMLQAHGLAPLAALRQRAGLSQVDAAEATGIKQPHISRLENGQVPSPDLATLQALAAAYGCTLDQVVLALGETVTLQHG